MKSVRFLFVLLIIFQTDAFADTIDYWTIKHSRTKDEFNQHSVTLSLAEIEANDSLFIDYFNDTPCPDCIGILTVHTHSALFSDPWYKGPANKIIKLPVASFVELYQKYYKGSVKIYYTEISTEMSVSNHEFQLFELQIIP